MKQKKHGWYRTLNMISCLLNDSTKWTFWDCWCVPYASLIVFQIRDEGNTFRLFCNFKLWASSHMKSIYSPSAMCSSISVAVWVIYCTCVKLWATTFPHTMTSHGRFYYTFMVRLFKPTQKQWSQILWYSAFSQKKEWAPNSTVCSPVVEWRNMLRFGFIA